MEHSQSAGAYSIDMIKEFSEGSTIIVDKPLNWTSFDVVNKIRWNHKQKLGVKKIKVGHEGTLDPLASGLLLICTGKFTKIISELQGQAKEYTGTFYIGATTPSYDLETEIDKTLKSDNKVQSPSSSKSSNSS